MLYCGIDVGSLTAQAVLLQDDQVRGFSSIRALPDPVQSAKKATRALFADCGVAPGEVRRTVATGYGRARLQQEGIAQGNVSEISCHGIGAQWLLPAVRTIIDIGGQDAKVIRVEAQGELANFVMNDKCASGTGRFLEVMSRTLGVELEELGTLALKAKETIALSSRCSIFCETEVLHFLQRGTPPEDLAAGIACAMGERVAALARRLGVQGSVTMTGGVAKNAAVRDQLERLLGVRLLPCPMDPQIVGALGAACLARRQAESGKGQEGL